MISAEEADAAAKSPMVGSSAYDSCSEEEITPTHYELGPDRVVGQGRLGIPEAPPEVNLSNVQRQLRSASPPTDLDLRRFVRAGDVLNYIGGNMWGHTVIALSTPIAFEVPVLYGPEQKNGSTTEEFLIALLKTDDTRLGISVDDETDKSCIIVKAVNEGGLVHEWNLANPQLQVQQEDRIVAVNGVQGNAFELFTEGQRSGVLQMRLCRAVKRRTLERNATAYAINVLQSASNQRDIRAALVVLAVHPETRRVCAARVAEDCAQLCQGHDGPVHVQVIMSPFDNDSLDAELFRFAVDEVKRAPLNQAWSFRTAVKSYLRRAHLRADRYKGEQRRLQLAQRLCEGWQARPVCSTIPPRVWLKYLLKKAYKQCLRPDGTQGQPPLGAAGHGLELAWLEEVLRLMPIRDDRVLPEELCKRLVGTGFWKELDLSRGPPKHRLHDGELQTTRGLEMLRMPPCRRSPCSVAGLENRDGAPVRLGSDCFTVYCGSTTSKPPCGPLDGPQCAACHWLEARLVT